MVLALAARAIAGDPLEALVELPGAPPPAPIINGAPATVDDWPMAGGLIVNGTATLAGLEPVSGRALMCSSTLVAPDVVLTAAHCVDVEGLIEAAATQGYTIESLEDLAFGWSRQEVLSQYDLMASVLEGPEDWPDDVVMAKAWVAHPEFDLLTLQVGLAENDDIALVFLERAVTDVPFAIVPTDDEAKQVDVGDVVEIVGWGQQEQDPLPGTVGEKVMATSWIADLAQYEMKVGEEYTDGRKCHGDSGGPSFLEVETTSAETWRVVGVTSHAWDATTDCRVTGGVDTRVDHHLAWLDETMRAACADGTRVWCEEPGIVQPPDEDGVFPWELDDGVATTGDADGAKGCGCDTTGNGGWVALLATAVLGRRRR